MPGARGQPGGSSSAHARPGRGPGLLPRGGALSARRRRHVARRPRPGRGGRGPAGLYPSGRAAPPGAPASETAPWRAGASIHSGPTWGRRTKPGGKGLGGSGGGVLLALALNDSRNVLKSQAFSLRPEAFQSHSAFQPFLGCHGGPPFLAMSALTFIKSVKLMDERYLKAGTGSQHLGPTLRGSAEHRQPAFAPAALGKLPAALVTIEGALNSISRGHSQGPRHRPPGQQASVGPCL